MARVKKGSDNLVFGLDIGTRSIVGTVGYLIKDKFHVVGQTIREHETRAMLDGQIHDIMKVGNTIKEVKEDLEKKLDVTLSDVCIAAAGRVLRTVTTKAEIVFEAEKEIDNEDIYNLLMNGVEQAYADFAKVNDSDLKFYCVGYTVVKYYMNGYPISTLERHKANNISVDLIATFLPDDVVDGLYKAVEIADLEVANLTLEPIAAMTAAIPSMYRMLNIALVDVGAGTSDISVTKEGSIIAYGMIPAAGDELTEALVKKYLIDFQTAEKLKTVSARRKSVTYKDIMGISHKITPEEIYQTTEEVKEGISKKIA